jgi:hypothetical protein
VATHIVDRDGGTAVCFLKIKVLGEGFKYSFNIGVEALKEYY